MRSIFFAFFLASCGGMVVTTSGIPQDDVTPPFFPLIAKMSFRQAFELLCPPVRSALDYRAFVATVTANPFLRFNRGFSSNEARTAYGTRTLTGWAATWGGIVPVELTLGNDAGRPCVLGGSIASAPFLPMFGSMGPPPPDEGAYLPAEALRERFRNIELAGDQAAGPRVVTRFRGDGNRLCTRWGKLNAQKETCVRVIARDDAYEMYDVDEGFLQTRLRPVR
jgi:hypothetical protein